MSPAGDFIHVAVGPSVVPVVIHRQNISMVYKIQFAFRTVCCCSRRVLARTINIIGSGPFQLAFPERCRIKLDVLFALCSAVGWNTREINADSANQRVFMFTEVGLHTTTPLAPSTPYHRVLGRFGILLLYLI